MPWLKSLAGDLHCKQNRHVSSSKCPPASNAASAEFCRAACDVCIFAVQKVQLSLKFEQEILQQARQAVQVMLVFMAHKPLHVRLSEVGKCTLRLRTW